MGVGPCPYDCFNKTEFGYCKTTGCINSNSVYNSVNKQVWVKSKPYVDDSGIYMPLEPYVQEGCAISTYQLVMTKEMFQEAYKRYILND